MPTKAELQDTVEAQLARIADLEIELWDAKCKIVEFEQTPDFLRGLKRWSAYNSPGNPICLASDNIDDEFSLTIYADEGALFGVVIADEDGQIRHMAGQIPADAVMQYLGLKAI